MKRFLTILFLLLLSVVLVGCNLNKNGDDKNGEDDFEATAINTILKTSNNNEEVKIEGVVFGVVNNGFYVADGKDGSIFVLTGTSPKVEVTVGDKVQVAGQFGVANNFPQIRNVEIEVVDSELTPDIEVIDGSVALIAELDNTDRVNSYARVVRLNAMLGQNTARMYTLTDENGVSVLISPTSNVDALESNLNKQVTLTVIIHNFLVGENSWVVSFVGTAADIVEVPYNFEDIVDLALADLETKVPKIIYGLLTLPTEHPVVPSIKYMWSVEDNNHLSISANGKVNINLDTIDHEITFKVTITDGREQETKDFVIISKGIVEQSVSELLNNLPEISMSYIHVKGLVVGIARNQSLSLRTLIIQDPQTFETTTVDFSNTGSYILNSSEEFRAVSVGDMISVKAKYRLTGRPTIMHVSDIKILSSDNEYTHDFENAYVLKDQESYEFFGVNYQEFNNKLVKFENPYLNFSTSSAPTDTNWVVLGHSENSGMLGYGDITGKRRLAFLIAAQNESLGDNSWYTLLDIPFSNQPGNQIKGSIYAYAIYVSDAYLAFIIPDWSAWVFDDQLSIERDLGAAIPATTHGGVIELVKEHASIAGGITWTSSDEAVINSITGEVKAVNEVAVVTLIANYKYQGTTHTAEYVVTVLPEGPLSISQVLTDVPNGINVKVSGLIAGFSSDGNNNVTRDGIIILDPQTGEMILINAMASVYPDASYGKYYDSEGNMLTIGDEIILDGTYFTSAAAIGSGKPQTNRRHIVVTSESTVVKVSSENTLTFDYENAIVIDSHEAQQALADDLVYGTLIKFVGTEETPFFIGGSTSNQEAELNVKIYFNEATTNDGTKYNGQTFSLKTDVNRPNGGATWQEDLFGISENFVAPTPENPRIPIIGEVYVVVTGLTGTYIQMSIVDVSSATTQRLNN